MQRLRVGQWIRAFKPDPVPEGLLRDMLEEARWSPSWGNTQPWELYVVSGEPLEKFKLANCARLDEGSPAAPDIRMPEQWTEPLKKRYGAVGKGVLAALGIARDDTKGRTEQTRTMFRLFEAPCLIVVSIDKCSSSLEYALLDLGLITQTICLLAHDRGLGTCIMACAVLYPSALRALLPDAESKLLAVGIALGYPDREAPINHFVRERAPLEESVVWVK